MHLCSPESFANYWRLQFSPSHPIPTGIGIGQRAVSYSTGPDKVREEWEWSQFVERNERKAKAWHGNERMLQRGGYACPSHHVTVQSMATFNAGMRYLKGFSYFFPYYSQLPDLWLWLVSLFGSAVRHLFILALLSPNVKSIGKWMEICQISSFLITRKVWKSHKSILLICLKLFTIDQSIALPFASCFIIIIYATYIRNTV
jgi:hypothetical protein